MTRLLPRVAGRIVIDTGLEESTAENWPGTEEIVLQWIDEALHLLGYQVAPLPKS